MAHRGLSGLVVTKPNIRHGVCPRCGRRGILVDGACSPKKRRDKNGLTYCERVTLKRVERAL